MAHHELALIVPCLDEAGRLRPAAFLEFVAARPHVGVLFVDDGSRDGTPGILDGMKREAGGAIEVLRIGHAGKAEAVRRGVLEAMSGEFELIGFWDADLATPLTAVDDFLAAARSRPNIEIFLGSRVNLLGRDVHRSAWRHYPGRAFATAVSIALDLPVYDTQCGAKVFRPVPAIRSAFSRPFRSRWIFDVEVLARYLRVPVDDGGPPRQARIYEVVVPEWHDIPGSKLRAADWLRSLAELVAIWRERRGERRSSG